MRAEVPDSRGRLQHVGGADPTRCYDVRMADLLTPRELALWTSSTVGKSEAEVTADPFAAEVIDKVSQYAAFLAGRDGTQLDAEGVLIPEWNLTPGDPNLAPFDVRMVVLQVCKRAYENPKQIVQEGGVGPIGGDRVLDVAALLMSLTESEQRTLTKYNLEGDPTGEGPELFTIRTTRGDETTALAVTLYMGDDGQVNLETSADPREWMIPMFGPGDPGDPNNL